MDLELSDEQTALRDSVRRCLADAAPITPYVREHVSGKAWAPDRAWSILVELGATGVLVAPDAGGLGLGMVEATIVAEEAGRALYPGPWAASAVGAVRLLRGLAAGRAAGALLSSIARGDAVAAPVLPSPRHADAPVVRLDGQHRLGGRVPGVLGPAGADVLLVVAADDAGRLQLVAVRTGEPGVAVGRDRSVDASRDVCTVALDDAVGEVLGTITVADVRAAGDALLVATGADALGAAQRVFELALAYAKERHQFGKPIGAFQAVQHLCVDMLETVELARGGVMHAAWALDAASPDDAHRAARRVKAFADRLATVGDTAIQVFGGIGFTWEHDSHLYLKRLLSWSAYLGAPAAYRRELGRGLSRVT